MILIMDIVTVAGEDSDCLQCKGSGSWYLCAWSLWLWQHSCRDGIATCQETVWWYNDILSQSANLL